MSNKQDENNCEPRRAQKGFSLIELIVVVAILAILVGILAPQYIKYVDKARKAADVTNLEHLVDSLRMLTIEQVKGNGGKGSVVFPKTDTTYAFVISDTDGKRPTSFLFKQGKDEDYAWAEGNWNTVSIPGDEGIAMDKIFGNGWRETKLKSKNYNSRSGKTRYIWVTCYITSTNDIEINYCPEVEQLQKDSS